MKINSINYAKPAYTGNMVSRVGKQKVQNNGMNLKVISMSDYMASPLSFKGRNKEQAIFYGAEVAPYSKKGGVGVVMKDYGMLLDAKNEVVVSPYYGGKKDKDTGKVLSGVTLSLYDEKDNLLFEGVTNNKGIFEASNLEIGKYYLLEKKALDNYRINLNKIWFEVVKNGELIKINLVNEYRLYLVLILSWRIG